MSKMLTSLPEALLPVREMFDETREGAKRDSTRVNLDLLWVILEEMRLAAKIDFSLAEVGRLLEKRGGPKTQSLRNAQGEHFRRIITAYAQAIRASTRYVAKDKSQVDIAIDLINDPGIRGVLRQALSDMKRLKHENDMLRSAYKDLRIGILAAPSTQERATDVLPPPQFTLSPRLLDALRKGIDPIRLQERGLSIGANGTILDTSGIPIFPPAFVTAIERVLEDHEHSATASAG